MREMEVRVTADWRQVPAPEQEGCEWQSASLLLKADAPTGLLARLAAWIGRWLLRLIPLFFAGAVIVEATS